MYVATQAAGNTKKEMFLFASRFFFCFVNLFLMAVGGKLATLADITVIHFSEKQNVECMVG